MQPPHGQPPHAPSPPMPHPQMAAYAQGAYPGGQHPGQHPAPLGAQPAPYPAPPSALPAAQPYVAPPAPTKKGSPVAAFFAVIAILAGLYAFLVAGMRGHGAGWEEMLIYCIPSIAGAIIGIGIRRNALTFTGLFFGLLAAVSFFLGA